MKGKSRLNGGYRIYCKNFFFSLGLVITLVSGDSYLLAKECKATARECIDEGIDLYNAGKLFEAESFLESVLRRFPNNAEAQKWLDKVKAAILKRQVVEKEVSRLYQRAKRYFLCGNYAKAVELFSEVLNRMPDHQYARRYLRLAKKRISQTKKELGGKEVTKAKTVTTQEEESESRVEDSRTEVSEEDSEDLELDVSLLEARLKTALLSLRRQMAEYLATIGQLHSERDAVMEQLLREKQSYVRDLEERIKEQESLVNKLSSERLKLQGELLQIDQEILLLQRRLDVLGEVGYIPKRDVDELYGDLEKKYRALLERESELRRRLQKEIQLREELKKRLENINESLREEMQRAVVLEKGARDIGETVKRQTGKQEISESRVGETREQVRAKEEIYKSKAKGEIKRKKTVSKRNSFAKGRKEFSKRAGKITKESGRKAEKMTGKHVLPKEVAKEKSLQPSKFLKKTAAISQSEKSEDKEVASKIEDKKIEDKGIESEKTKEMLIAERDLRRDCIRKAKEFYSLGIKAMKKKDYMAAVNYFVKVVDLDPTGYGRRATNLLAKAKRLWEKEEEKRMLSKKRELEQLRGFYKARAIYKTGNYEEALRLCNELLKKYPDFSLAKELKGLIVVSMEEKNRNIEKEKIFEDISVKEVEGAEKKEREKSKVGVRSSQDFKKGGKKIEKGKDKEKKSQGKIVKKKMFNFARKKSNEEQRNRLKGSKKKDEGKQKGKVSVGKKKQVGRVGGGKEKVQSVKEKEAGIGRKGEKKTQLKVNEVKKRLQDLEKKLEEAKEEDISKDLDEIENAISAGDFVYAERKLERLVLLYPNREELKEYLSRVKRQHRNKLFSDAIDDVHSLIDKKEYCLAEDKLNEMLEEFPERKKEISIIRKNLQKFLVLPYIEEAESLIKEDRIESLRRAKSVLEEARRRFPRDRKIQRLYQDVSKLLRDKEKVMKQQEVVRRRMLSLVEKELKENAAKFAPDRSIMKKVYAYQEKKRREWYEKKIAQCRALVDSGQFVEAEKVLRELERVPKPYKHQVFRLRKEILDVKGRKGFSTCLELAKAAIKIYDFESAEKYLNRARQYLPDDLNPELKKTFEELERKLKFYKVQQALKAARMRLEAGDFPGAKVLVKDVLRHIDPNNDEAKEMLKQIERSESLYYADVKLRHGIMALKQGDYETAVSLAKEGLQLDSKNSELWDLYRRARSAWLRESLQRRTLLREIEQEAAGKRRLKWAKDRVKHQNLEYEYKKQLLTGEVVAMLKQAHRALVEQNFDRAIALCETVLDYDTDNPEARLLLDLIALTQQEIQKKSQGNVDKVIKGKVIEEKKNEVFEKSEEKRVNLSKEAKGQRRDVYKQNTQNRLEEKEEWPPIGTPVSEGEADVKKTGSSEKRDISLNGQNVRASVDSPGNLGVGGSSMLAMSNKVGSDSSGIADKDVVLEEARRALYRGDYDKVIELASAILSEDKADEGAKRLLEKAKVCKQKEQELLKEVSVREEVNDSRVEGYQKGVDSKGGQLGNSVDDVGYEEVGQTFRAAKIAYKEGDLSTAKKLFEDVCDLENMLGKAGYAEYARKYLWLIQEREREQLSADKRRENYELRQIILNKLYDDAEELERRKQYRQAKAIYSSILSLFPEEEFARKNLMELQDSLYKKEMQSLEDKIHIQDQDMLKQVSEEGIEKNRLTVKKGDATKLKPQPIVEVSPIKEKLQKKVSATFSDVPLVDILNFFAEQVGVNIIISPKIGSAEYKASINVKDMSLESVLKYLLKSYNLTYQIDEDAIWVTTPEELEREPMETKVYHLRRGIGLYTKFSPSTSGSVELGSGAKVSEMRTLKDILEEAVDWPGGSKLVLDERTSSLIVTNTPANLKRIDEILWNLDVVPVQVLIEAKFLEVDVTDLKELGVSWKISGSGWAVDKKHGDFGHGVKGDSGFSFPEFSNESSGLNLTYQGVLTKPEFEAVLHALYQSQNTRTLSSPRVTTLNNQTATIKVVDEWIYPTRYEFQIVQYDLNGDGDYDDAGETRYENVPTDFVKRDVGIILNVTPSVGDDLKTITLSLVPEVSDAVADYFEYTGGVKLPKFTSRNLSTNVVVDNTDTVVLGGLIRENRNSVVTKVPILGDIPVIGNLFKKSNSTVNRKNLLIFVTATIINPEGDAVVFDGQKA